jgi:hypothetical protein
MRYIAFFLFTGIIIAFLLAAGCTGGSSAGTPTQTPTPQETVVVPATTPACPDGTDLCPNGSCRNITADIHNCGGCGNTCPVAFICYKSQCVNPDTGVVAPPYT